jgi:iron(III) transport system ATP-binding protein
MNKPASKLVVEDLHLQYGDNKILQGVSMTLNPGEVVALLGASGSGKTTLLRSVAGLEQPSRGRISIGDTVLYDGANGVEMPVEKRNLGLVFQSYALWPHRSVFDNIAYGLRLRGVPASEIDSRVNLALTNLGLGALATRLPHQLSGGQQQRVAIARALVYNPPVVLMDEPLSNLDAKLREEARAWLRELIVRLGLSALVVTHDQTEAMAMSDKILLLNAGRIEQQGTPEELYNRPQTQFTAEFMGSNNHLSGRLRKWPTVARCSKARAGVYGAPRAVHSRRATRPPASSVWNAPGSPTARATIGCAPSWSLACSSAIARRICSSSVRCDCAAMERRCRMPAAATAIWSFPRTISGYSLRPQRRRRRRPEGSHCAPAHAAMARIDIAVAWLVGERARAAPLLLELLRAIRDLGSIQRASVALGISYRNGWGLLESWSAELARPLIDKTRGRGTRLTELGELLLRCDDEVRAALDPHCAKLRERIDRRLGLAHDAPGGLTISASHDLALAAVRDAVNETGVVQLDVQFRGSIDSIDAMIAERCELAGFHVDGRGGAELVAPYRQRLHAHRHAIIRFAERRQGLLLSPRNPLGIRSLADLPGGPRLVNRQPASGTRLLFDRLLRAAKIDRPASPATTRRNSRILRSRRRSPPARPTSGSASRPLPPSIVSISCPLATEQYCLALRRDHLRDVRVVALIDYLASATCRELIGALPGYRASHAGEVIGVDEVLPAASATVVRKGARRGARLA